MTDHDPYTDPDTGVLRNLLGIEDADELERVERLLVWERISEGAPEGNFDLQHLQAIHRHLFQDVYDWAGQVRTVEINKDGSQFQMRRFIEAGMEDVHRRLVTQDNLRNLTPDEFARQGSVILGDVNHCHPFREGNGRAQLEFFDQLANQAGHSFDASTLDPQRWVEASRAAHLGDYQLMEREIRGAIGLDRYRANDVAEQLERIAEQRRQSRDRDDRGR